MEIRKHLQNCQDVFGELSLVIKLIYATKDMFGVSQDLQNI